MKTYSNNPQPGFSVIELLIVLVVSGILVTLAVSQLGGARANLQRQNIAREFKVDLERARFDSVKRRANQGASMAVVSVIDETSYSVTTDLNQNGLIDPSETRIVDFSGTPGVRMVLVAGITAPLAISFDQKGHAAISDYYGNSTDHVLFCGIGCSGVTANNSNANAVYVSRTGTVAMIGGGQALPSVADPNISTVVNNVGINPDVAVWTGPFPTPIPPAPSSPSPTPTPAPVPSPVPSASPTPLPVCTLNQRPGSPPTCLCLAPWFVGRSGKCAP